MTIYTNIPHLSIGDIVKKLALNLDGLSVQSYVTTPEGESRRGTVMAHNFTDYYGITCVAPGICSGSGDSQACPGPSGPTAWSEECPATE